MKKLKFISIITITIISFSYFGFLSMYKIAADSHNQTEFETGDIGLQEINIQYFPLLSLPGPEYTVLSWLSFLGLLASIGLILFWVFLILRAVAGLYGKADDPEGLSLALQRMKSLFVGLILAFSFPVILSFLGAIFGIGQFWTWPAAFRECKDEETPIFGGRTTRDKYNYYFQALIDIKSDSSDTLDSTDAVALAYDVCNIDP